MSQPDALKFADTLDQVAALFGCPAALLLSAAELRRLHAENEELRIQASTLRKYWHHHKQKGDDVKAQANLDLAEQMAAA